MMLSIREHYDAWRRTFGKPANESRYLIFKRHFLEQQAWNEGKGENHELNEFGDVSEVEYLQLLQGFVVGPRMTRDYAVLEPPINKPKLCGFFSFASILSCLQNLKEWHLDQRNKKW
jgi:hypothetical protein